MSVQQSYVRIGLVGVTLRDVASNVCCRGENSLRDMLHKDCIV